jgi:ABC-type methionine transport system ATPase subunit
MDRRCFRFTFPPALVTEPLIYELGRQFDVVTNIRRANVTKDSGWVILELQGDREEIDRAVRWATSAGLTVEPVQEECIG